MADTEVDRCKSDDDPTEEDTGPEKTLNQRRLEKSVYGPVDDTLDEDYVNEATRNAHPDDHQWELVWRNVILAVLYHTGAVVGLYLAVFQAKRETIYWTVFYVLCSSMGVTAGAHRLWAHKSYKANLPLRLILVSFNNIAFQNPVIIWVRDHRAHHKYTETDADPHNAKRGFFFSHMGWLLVKKHEAVRNIGTGVSVDDLWSDPLLAFQYRHYMKLVILFSAVIPTAVPAYFWGERLIDSFLVAGVFRYILQLHLTWCVNSVAHLYGHRPYDKNIFARQSLLTASIAFGEGWHNFHHKFPRDYRCSEYPAYWFNLTKSFIDFFALIGWAYDLQTTNPEAIKRTKSRYGDGTE